MRICWVNLKQYYSQVIFVRFEVSSNTIVVAARIQCGFTLITPVIFLEATRCVVRGKCHDLHLLSAHLALVVTLIHSSSNITAEEFTNSLDSCSHDETEFHLHVRQ